MLDSRKLVLRKETLSELSGPELLRVAGAAAASGIPCIIDVPHSIATCVDTLTIATCTCPTGASCPCPTGYGCA